MLEELELNELKMLKSFFEMCLEKDRPKDQVVGTFGAMPRFFGNVVQYNDFDIPLEAMKLIYQHNKQQIDNRLKYLKNVIP